MKHSVLVLLIFMVGIRSLMAQDKFFTKTGKVSFYSKAPLEDIEAINKSVTAILDSKTGNLQFAVLMNGFEFDKALMQEHFNEDYLETDKYPKADFKGSILNNAEINYAKDGEYSARVKGQLTIHGETKDVQTIGKVVVKSGRLLTNAKFTIHLSDYKITISKLVKDQLSNNIQVIVDCNLEPLNRD